MFKGTDHIAMSCFVVSDYDLDVPTETVRDIFEGVDVCIVIVTKERLSQSCEIY